MNRLSLALLRLWRRPLPEVFRELAMEPIGASPEWEWHGYRNSWVEIDGRRVKSVAGGGHWGGGVFISARDQARIGLMLLRRGMWDGRRILSEAWIDRMIEPCPLYRTYGYLSVKKPPIPGLIHLVWPFVTWFTERIFAEDKDIVEHEQAAYDSQGADWNNEVFLQDGFA